MSDYISKEVTKIITDKKLEFPLNLAMASAWVAGNFKGSDLKIFNVKGKSTLGDYFVIASANNQTQLRSMAEEIIGQFKKHEVKILSTEGLDGTNWVLLDFGDIIVHLFLEDARFVYNLDELWKTSAQVEIPSSYYFSEPKEAKTNKKDDSENYF